MVISQHSLALIVKLTLDKQTSCMFILYQLNKKHASNKIKRHTNKHPGKPIYFPCSKKQSPDQTKSRAHQIMSVCLNVCLSVCEHNISLC